MLTINVIRKLKCKFDYKLTTYLTYKQKICIQTENMHSKFENGKKMWYIYIECAIVRIKYFKKDLRERFKNLEKSERIINDIIRYTGTSHVKLVVLYTYNIKRVIILSGTRYLDDVACDSQKAPCRKE